MEVSGSFMPKAKESVLHQQALLVMGLFTGFALTALVVIMQSPRTFHVAVWPLSAQGYFETLTTTIALVGSVCIFGVLAAMEVAGGIAEIGSGLDKFGYACFLIGLFGLVAVLPLLLLPFTRIGAVTVIASEIILLVVYFSSQSKATSPKPRNSGRRR